jgi:hypothetical protein
MLSLPPQPSQTLALRAATTRRGARDGCHLPVTDPGDDAPHRCEGANMQTSFSLSGSAASLATEARVDNVVAFRRSEIGRAAPSTDAAVDRDWTRRCAYSLVEIDRFISASDAADLAAEMSSHLRWRELEPDEAARALFTCSLA